MKYNFESFKAKLLQLDLRITDRMEKQFGVYYDLLIEWNRIMNLTSVTEFDEVVDKHFLDSAALGYYYSLNRNIRMIDIGSGAGFPGIPLKIMYPKLRVTLADSLNKRVRFLNEVILQLKLTDISAVHERAEDLARKGEYREQFDLCVSRAVANLSSLSEYCLPFVKIGGTFISYKSKDVECETGHAEKAVDLLGGRLAGIHKFPLPGTDYQRSFAVIDKVRQTPKKYPRKAGIPGRQPLGQS